MTRDNSLPFDRIVIGTEGARKVLTTSEFLALPLRERVASILGEDLEFRCGMDIVDRSTALKALRAVSG